MADKVYSRLGINYTMLNHAEQFPHSQFSPLALWAATEEKTLNAWYGSAGDGFWFDERQMQKSVQLWI